MTSKELTGATGRGDTAGMNRQRNDGGTSLLETCAALALTSAAALGFVSGLQPLVCAARVETARSILLGALLEARRTAYASQTNSSVEAHAGDGYVVLRPSGLVRSFGEGVELATVPADGAVEFRASGLADNATLALECRGATATVIVNQRGVVR